MAQSIVKRAGPAALIDREKYGLVQEAVLRVLPASGEGLTWVELSEIIAPMLPDSIFHHAGLVRWYARAVQMDLEAQGVVERIPDSRPIRIRRVAQ